MAFLDGAQKVGIFEVDRARQVVDAQPGHFPQVLEVAAGFAHLDHIVRRAHHHVHQVTRVLARGFGQCLRGQSLQAAEQCVKRGGAFFIVAILVAVVVAFGCHVIISVFWFHSTLEAIKTPDSPVLPTF